MKFFYAMAAGILLSAFGATSAQAQAKPQCKPETVFFIGDCTCPSGYKDVEHSNAYRKCIKLKPGEKVAPPPSFVPVDAINLQQGKRYPALGNKHYLIFQTDGNIAIYATADNRFIWGVSHVFGDFRQIKSVIKRNNGNLDALDAGKKVIWSTRAAGVAGTKLDLTPQGVLQIVSPQGKVLWRTN